MMPATGIESWRLYVITDYRLSRGRPQEEVIQAAIAGGADVIQFREKELGGPILRAAAEPVAAACRRAGVPLIVNDDLELARTLQADGIHVGQRDLSAAVVRERLGASLILGVSARTPEEAQQAIRDGADYLGVGPIFNARTTKPDAEDPIGLEGLRAVCAVSAVPVVAIGGINAGNAERVIQAGARAVAVISAVVAPDDVARAASGIKAAVERATGRSKVSSRSPFADNAR